MELTTIARDAVVNVVIVDGTPFVRERLKALLHTHVPQVDVIGEAAEAQARESGDAHNSMEELSGADLEILGDNQLDAGVRAAATMGLEFEHMFANPIGPCPTAAR